MTMDISKAFQPDVSSYHDLGALDDLRAVAQKDQGKALKQVASQFEAMFMQMLMKQMRQSNAAFETDSPLNNSKTQNYRDMYDNQMALDLSQTGSLGLADLIVSQLDPDSAQITPASVLRTQGNFSDSFKTLGASQEPSIESLSSELKHEGLDFSRYNPRMANTIPVSDIISAPSNFSLDKSSDKAVDKNAVVGSENGQSFASPQQFIDTILPLAKRIAVPAGIEPLALVAQSALETGWGKKVIRQEDGSSSYNLFGIKADSRWDGEKTTVGTLEYKDGLPSKQKSDFRSYDGYESSMKDYVNFVQGPRYSEALANGGDPVQYANELQRAGYATDPEYANKIEAILNSDWLSQHHSGSEG